MANKRDDGVVTMSPDEAKGYLGEPVEAFMRDVSDSCLRNHIRAVTVCAFTDSAGCLAFSAGIDADWRELASMLATKMAVDVGDMMHRKPAKARPAKGAGGAN